MKRAIEDRRLRLIPIAIITAATLVACGGGGDSDSSAAAAAPNAGAGNALVPPTTSPENAAPTIRGSAATTATVGQTYSFTPVASDSNGDKLTFSAAGLPAWASINAATGQISGSPTAAATHTGIRVSVSDGSLSASLPAFTLTVAAAVAAAPGATPAPSPAPAPSASAVTLAWEAPTTNSDGTPLNDLTGYNIHYGTSSQNYTDEIVISNPSVTRYVVEGLPPGNYYFAVSAYNSKGVESPRSGELSERFN